MEMKVEIWSDVVCPFCYMGKQKFEIALEQFEHKDEVEVLWHSFQLNPEFKAGTAGDIHDYLAAKYGRTREWAKEMNDSVAAMAQEVGLHYDFDKAVPVNTFDTHRLIHLAGEHGLQAMAEERFFAAYFTEGKNLSDPGTLVELGTDIGLDAMVVRRTLKSSYYADAVRGDMEEADELGIHAVPFFVIDRKYAISGVQPSHLFLETLEKVWEEERQLEESSSAGKDPQD
jgi:predicted DsbA family dithiol-disulfide isomerase